MTKERNTIDRRQLIALLAGSAAALPVAAANAQQPALPSSPFQLGIASGSPAPDGFVLWTRLILPADLATAAIPVEWSLHEHNKPGVILRKGVMIATPQLGHSIHIEIEGLAPDQWYGYSFRAGGHTSMSGLARTLPAHDSHPARLRLAYASCQRWEDGHYAAYRHMRADQPDFVLFLGDYIYENKSRDAADSVRPHPLPRVKSLDDYRARYALYKSDPALQAMHAACPWLVTWDDHELENDYAGRLSHYDTPHFEALRIAAYQAYYEHMPLRASCMINGLEGLQAGGELRLYQCVDFGRLARIYMLDARQYRDAPLPDSRSARLHPAPPPRETRTMLGAAQEQWLENALQQASKQGTGWNVIAQQTRFTPGNYLWGEGKKANQDRWDGYPHAREQMIASILRAKPRNPVVLGGDIHQNWVAHIHQTPYDIASPVIGTELSGTSISSKREGKNPDPETLHRENPHALLNDRTRRGYGLIELSAQQMEVRLVVLDDASDPASGQSSYARLEQTSGGKIKLLKD